MRFQRGREHEIVRLPFSPGFVRICRSSGNSNQRFAREGIDRLATSAILNREQTELVKIETARIDRRLTRLAILSITGRTRCGLRFRLRNRNYKCANQSDVEISHGRAG